MKFCAQKKSIFNEIKALYDAPCLKTIDRERYELSKTEELIYGKSLEPGEFCEYYWPLFNVNDKSDVKCMNDWIACLGASLKLGLKEYDAVKNATTEKSNHAYVACNEHNAARWNKRCFLVKFGTNDIYELNNAEKIDDVIMKAMSSYFFRFSLDERISQRNVSLNHGRFLRS